jgi:hypothetical protein
MSIELGKVQRWTTQLRYEPGLVEKTEAEAFMRAVDAVVQWVKGRL